MTDPRPAGASVVDGVDVDAVAAAVRACPAVGDLSGGLLGSAGTYLPGRRVRGVVVRPSSSGGAPLLEIHVAAMYGPPLSEVGQQVRAALAAVAPGSPVDVVIEDVVSAGEPADVDAGPDPAPPRAPERYTPSSPRSY